MQALVDRVSNVITGQQRYHIYNLAIAFGEQVKRAALAADVDREEAERAALESLACMFEYIDTLTSDQPLMSAAILLGKQGGIKGGAVKSEAKSTSSAENGKKGGRPKTEKIGPYGMDVVGHLRIGSKTFQVKKFAKRSGSDVSLKFAAELFALPENLGCAAGDTAEIAYSPIGSNGWTARAFCSSVTSLARQEVAITEIRLTLASTMLPVLDGVAT
jgi:hypothetical protein